MKHTTKQTPRASKSAKNRMIGLRVDPSFMSEIEAIAAAEDRSLAYVALVCARLGLKEIKARAAKLDGN